MPILKQERYDRYVVYPATTLELLRGEGDALALHVYLMSRPDGWEVRASDIESAMGWGRDRRRSAQKVLEANGLFSVTRAPLQGSVYAVWDKPVGRMFRQTDLPTVDKPAPLVSNDSRDIPRVNTEKTYIGHWEAFWAAYPRRVNKAKARAKFFKLTEEQMLKAIDDVKARVLRYPQWCDSIRIGDMKYVPHPTTYLNGALWEDEWIPSAPAPVTTTDSSRYWT